LSKLSASGLFVYMTSSGGYRFHNLLKDHLQRLCRKDLARWVDANRKAADYYWETGEGLQAVDHLIAAGDWEVAAEGLSMIAAELVKSGRYDALAGRPRRSSRDWPWRPTPTCCCTGRIYTG